MRPIRYLAAVAIATLVGGGAALAQSASPPAAPQAAATQQPLTIDSPIEVLVAVPQAKAVLDANIPGLTEHPMYDKFKGENLRVLAPKFGGAITPKVVAKLQADLAALALTTASH